MSFESLISFFIRFNWVFLAGWILLLGAAFAAAFPVRSAPATQKNHPSDGPPSIR